MHKKIKWPESSSQNTGIQVYSKDWAKWDRI